MKTQVSTTFMFVGILFAACLLISNILAVKIIMIGPWVAPAGVLIFPVSYFIGDVVGIRWKSIHLILKSRIIILNLVKYKYEKTENGKQ